MLNTGVSLQPAPFIHYVCIADFANNNVIVFGEPSKGFGGLGFAFLVSPCFLKNATAAFAYEMIWRNCL